MQTIDVSPFSGNPQIQETLEVPESLQILPDGADPAEGYSCFRILHPQKGDERISWDRRSPEQIREARELFLSLVKKGLTPFRVGPNGKASPTIMQEFDAGAEEVIFVPTSLVRGG